MKTKTQIILFLALFSGLISCTKDDTILPAETISRIDYIGTWTCVELPQTKNQNFDCIISIDANTENNIKISNFANLHGSAFAIVNGKNAILPRQTISGNTFEGYGNFENKNLINWHYYIKDNTDSLIYNTTFNR